MDVDSRWAALALGAGALLLIMALAAAEAALATISRSRVRTLIEKGVGGAEAALRLIDDMPQVRAALSLLEVLLAALAVAAAMQLTYQARGSVAATVAGLLLAMLLLQTVAAAVGARWYHLAAPALAPLVAGLVRIVSPLRQGTTRASRRLAGSPTIEGEEALRLDEEELRVLASVVGEEQTEIAEEGREMIYNVVALSQTTAREVMIPRPDIVALRANISMMEALDTIIREGHSRIPVFEETIDNVVGILYAKDMLAYLRDGRTDIPIRSMLRPAIYVPTSKRADELLGDLQGGRVHLAIVFDEYGGTAGLVTIEDVLEEIVGEIQDEYDAEEASFVRVSEWEAVVSGRYDIDDLNDEMELELPTDENDTVGGLIYSALGRVPLVGDEVRMDTTRFVVLAMVGRRIASVRVLVDHAEPPAPATEPSEAPALDEATLPPAPPAPTGGAQVGLARLFG